MNLICGNFFGVWYNLIGAEWIERNEQMIIHELPINVFEVLAKYLGMHPSAEQILIENVKFVRVKKEEEKKMTRAEALKKLPKEKWYGNEANIGYFLDALEALGLIKFEEEVVAWNEIIVQAESVINNTHTHLTYGELQYLIRQLLRLVKAK